MIPTTYVSKNIYTQKTIWQRSAHTELELMTKIEYLSQKRQSFAKLAHGERIATIALVKNVLQANKAAFARMICEEVGRCLRECEAEIEKTIQLVEYYTSISGQMLLPKNITTQASISQVCYEPLGLILAVMPWNYPIWQMLRFAIPALCVGNACLIKPSPSVGRVTEFFFSHIDGIWPLDYVLLEDGMVELAIANCQGLAFTGSVNTGRILASIAGRYLRKTVLELGGSNAFIVFSDANLEQAAKDACYSRFRDAGQSCNAAKRIIVEKSCVKAFTELLLAEAEKITCGDPSLTSTQMGPLHLDGVAFQMQAYVDDAKNRGADCYLGGVVPDNPIFYPPTILGNVSRDSLVMQEEVFGPVLPIITVESKEQAIEVANESPFGLGASIYSENMEKAQHYSQLLEVGSVYINRHTSSDLRMPFGGVKDSGYGRELSEFGLIEFVNVKSYWQR